jgi:DUF4097 and DUF4098 domain-containing protein YvlB
MAGYPPPYPPPGPPYGQPSRQDLKYQRRILKDQARAQRELYRDQVRSTRRRSVIGPILLVAVGIVFLLIQTGRLRGELFWGWYGHWWPLLLVLVGVVLLVEWAIDRARPHDPGRPSLQRSFGGGALTLIVLLAIAGFCIDTMHNRHDFFHRGFSINPDNFEEFLGDKHESDEERIEAFPEGGLLTIDNSHGDVSVTGTSSDNQVHISVHKQIFSRSDSEAASRARELTPRLTRSGKMLAISMPALNGTVSDLTISVPAATGVTVTANHGEVRLSSLGSAVNVTANHGDVVLSAIKGGVTAHVNNSGSSFSARDITGPLSLEGHGQDLTLSNIGGAVNLAGDFYGSTHLERISGEIKYHTSRTDFQLARLDGEMTISPDADLSVDRALGPVVLTTRNRNITLERIAGDLSVTNRNGSVDVTSAPPLGNVTVQNRNGSVSLTLPDKAAFTVSATTDDGDMNNDFSLSSQDHDDRKTLNGNVGNGGSLIRINTSQGDVALRKASIAPLPPHPPVPPAPPISITGDDGESISVGKNGVRIISGADGGSVIVGKDGLHITGNPNGSSNYRGKDGTQLNEQADGAKLLILRDGTRYSVAADGAKMYRGSDGISISLEANGSLDASTTNGDPLSDRSARERLRHADDEIRRAERQRDAERRALGLNGGK